MLWHGNNFRGIINKAKQMIFDNTGTDLISTNAEDAIKEVNSNLTGIDISTDIQFNFTPTWSYCKRFGNIIMIDAGGSVLNTNSALITNLPSYLQGSTQCVGFALFPPTGQFYSLYRFNTNIYSDYIYQVNDNVTLKVIMIAN